MDSKPTASPPEVTLNEVRDNLRQLGKDVNKNHYRIGCYYNLVVDKKMAALGGFKTSQKFFRQEVKEISQTVLSLCGTVARAFSESACSGYSVYHLYALMTYGKAAKLTLSKEEPGPTPIEVPKEDGTFEQKPFSECTVEEVRAAARHKRAKDQPQMPDEVLKRVEALREHITSSFPEEKSLTRLNARMLEDKTYVTLKDVLLDDLELLTETLMDSLGSTRSAA
jgi:hypothetical protein